MHSPDPYTSYSIKKSGILATPYMMMLNLNTALDNDADIVTGSKLYTVGTYADTKTTSEVLGILGEKAVTQGILGAKATSRRN
jgi:hypothetical protein